MLRTHRAVAMLVCVLALGIGGSACGTSTAPGPATATSPPISADPPMSINVTSSSNTAVGPTTVASSAAATGQSADYDVIDGQGYTYHAHIDAMPTFVTATKSINAPPGKTKFRVMAVGSPGTATNTTPNRNAPGFGGDLQGLWPKDSLACKHSHGSYRLIIPAGTYCRAERVSYGTGSRGPGQTAPSNHYLDQQMPDVEEGGPLHYDVLDEATAQEAIADYAEGPAIWVVWNEVTGSYTNDSAVPCGDMASGVPDDILWSSTPVTCADSS